MAKSKELMYAATIIAPSYGQTLVGIGKTLDSALNDLKNSWGATEDEEDFDEYDVEFYKMELLKVRVEKTVKLVEEDC